MKTRYTVISLASIITVSLFIRVVLPFERIFGGVAVKFADIDSYYHAEMVRNGGGTLYHAALRCFTELPIHNDIALMILPILCHVVTVIMVYLLARRLFGAMPALVAALLFVLLPGEYLGRSSIGCIDYHVVEVMLVTLISWLIVWGNSRRGWWKLIFTIPIAAMFYLYYNIWPGSFLYALIPVATIAAYAVTQGSNKLIKASGYIGLACIGMASLVAISGFNLNTWITTYEALPLFSIPIPFITSVAWIVCGIGVFYLWRRLYRETKSIDILFLIVWTVAMMAATFLQRRFAYYLAVNIAVVVTYLIYITAQYIEPKYIGRIVTGIVVIICLAMLPQTVTNSRSVYYAPSDDWVSASLWLRDNTPEDSVIAAWWDYGYLIKYTGERDPIANPSQDPEKIKQVAELLTTDKELSGFDYLVLDNKTMTVNYAVVIQWSGKNFEYMPTVQKLWQGETIDGISNIYENSTIRIYKNESNR